MNSRGGWPPPASWSRAGRGVVPADHEGRDQLGVLGRDQGIGPGDYPLEGHPVEDQQAQGVGDRDGVLGRGHPFSHHIDHCQVQCPVGQQHPVIQVAAGRRLLVGGQVEHAELGLGHHRRGRADRLLQFVDDVALGRFEVGHGDVVVECHRQMGDQGFGGGEGAGRGRPVGQPPQNDQTVDAVVGARDGGHDDGLEGEDPAQVFVVGESGPLRPQDRGELGE